MNTFLSIDNKKLLYNVLNENQTIPSHIKNATFFEKELTSFYNERPNVTQNLMDANKTFLSYYIHKNKTMTNSHIQDIRLNEFDSQLKQKRDEFENTIILKKPEPIHFDETVVMIELDMEKELKLKIEERNNEIPPVSISKPTNELTSIQSENKIKNETKLQILNETRNYDNQKDKKKVSFSVEEEMPSNFDAVLVELVQIKQEMVDLKKMIGSMMTFLSVYPASHPSVPPTYSTLSTQTE